MRIDYEGKVVEVPDDFSPEEIDSTIEALPTWGKTLRAIPGTAAGLARQALGGMIQQEAELPPTVPATNPLISRFATALYARASGWKPDQAMAEVGKIVAEQGAEKVKENDPGNLDYWKRATLSGGASVLSQLPGLAASITFRSPAPAVASAVALTGGQTYAESREAGDTPESAIQRAAVDMTAEGLLEYFPTKFLVDKAGGPLLRTVAGTLIREVPSEVLTTAVQSANARLRDKELKGTPWSWEEYTQDMLDTVGSTLISAPLTAGAAGGLSRLTAGGPKREPASPPPPSSDDAASTPPAPIEGAVNPPLTSPSNIQPTQTPDSNTKDQLDALIASIDADMITDEQVEEAKAKTAQLDAARRTAVDVAAKTTSVLDLVPSAGEDIGDLGASRKQASNADGYVNPNTEDRKLRTVLYGPEGTEGVAFGANPPQPGTYVIGAPTADRSEDYLVALAETYEQKRKELMPNATLVISNEQLPSNYALGWAYNVGPNFHFIVPGVLRNMKDPATFNPNARATVFFTATHEFGHALIENRFFENITPEVSAKIQGESKAGLISEESIAQMPELQQAVIREYNQLKARIMDGSLTAQEFVEKWLSPGKLARQGEKETLGANWLKGLGVAPTAPARDVGLAIARQTVQGKTDQGANLKVRDQAATYFSLHEYLAEQTARAAYKNKWDEKSPLEKFLKNVVASLRKLFVSLKQDGIIKPGVAFQEWLDSLTAIGKGSVTDQAVTAAKMKGKGPKAKSAPSAKKAGAKKPVSKRQKVEHNAATDTTQDMRDRSMRALTTLELSGAISEDQARKLYDLIERNEFDAFIDEFQKYAVKNVKFELDPESEQGKLYAEMEVLRAGLPETTDGAVIAEAHTEFKRNGFASRFFKAWFGDWQNDPQNASKIREGAILKSPFSLGQDGYSILPDMSVQLPPAGSATAGQPWRYGGGPLILFHATRSQRIPGKLGDPTDLFDAFSRGDLGFHFGTVRAAHVRGYGIAWAGEAGTIPDQATIDKATDQAQKLLSQDTNSIALNYAQFVRKDKLIGLTIIPTVLNIRNPLYIGTEPTDNAFWSNPQATLTYLTRMQVFSEVEAVQILTDLAPAMMKGSSYARFEPIRRALIAKGYDGVVYDNTYEGDTSFVAFHPNQVKSVLASRTFSRSDNMHMEMDYDASTPEGAGGGRFLKSIRNFLNDVGPLRRALRKVQHSAYYLLELQQLSHLNPDVTGLTMMSEDNTRYNAQKSRLQAQADAVAHTWADLGKEWDSKVSKFLFAERDSGALWFDVTKEGTSYKYAMNATTVQKLQDHGIDLSTPEGEHAAKLILDAKNALMYQLNELERSLIIALQNRYAGAGSESVVNAVIPLKRQIHDMRKLPFFPQGRFGNLMLTVERKRTDAPGYEVVARYAFESRSEWEQAAKEAQAKASVDERVRAHELTDTEYVLMALPLHFVDLAATELGLNDQQIEQLMQILQPVKTEKAFSKYDEARLGLKGWSTDAMRSYANFTWHNANMIAKLEYRSRFNLGIRDVESNLRAAQYAGPQSLPEVERLGRIASYMKRTRDYIMAPPYEAQSVRAVVSIAYLALNVKTALINFYGLVTTWSDLTTRYGQLEGNARFFRAVKRGFQSIDLTDLNQRREGDYLPSEIQAALDRALEEGVLSQSYAYHLAGLANAGNLDRLFGHSNRQTARRWTQRTVDVGMYPFRLMELATRRVSFLAEFEAASKDPNIGMTDPYTEAVSRTNKLQNDYSTGNRAPFLRGIKTQPGNPLAKVLEPAIPLATVFMTFTQHMAFHAYGGYELGERRATKQVGETPKSFAGSYTAKIWLLTLLLAGYEGLPGAENLLDLVEAAWRKLGGRKPMRQELRELIQSVDGDPQLWSRGLGHNTGWLPQQLGIQGVPEFDISRSVGLGRMFPGTEVLAHPKDSVAENVGTLALDLAGPTGAFVKWGLDLFVSNKPPAETFARMPGGLGNIWAAYKWSQDGVRAPSQALITHDLKTGKIRDLTAGEIFGKALGFNPAVVSQNREVMFAQYDRKIYWQTRRDILMDNYWVAHVQKDREAQADVRKAVTKFNESIPVEYRDLRVTTADIMKSVQSRERIKRSEEQQSTPQRRYRSLYKDVKKSFEQP